MVWPQVEVLVLEQATLVLLPGLGLAVDIWGFLGQLRRAWWSPAEALASHAGLAQARLGRAQTKLVVAVLEVPRFPVVVALCLLAPLHRQVREVGSTLGWFASARFPHAS